MAKCTPQETIRRRRMILEHYTENGQLTAQDRRVFGKLLKVNERTIGKYLTDAIRDINLGYDLMSVEERRAEYIIRLRDAQRQAKANKAWSALSSLMKVESHVMGIDKIEVETHDVQITIVSPTSV